MQFNDISGLTGLVQDVWFLLFGDDLNHSADYSLAAITRNVNRYYDMVTAKIMQADWRWQWDDNNATDLPISDVDLVATQRDYGVNGVDYLKISRVDIFDQNGIGIHLKEFYLEDLPDTADSDFEKTSGTPKYYRKQANSIFLYPTPIYSYPKGMRIFYQRVVSYFLAADTTKVPGFAQMFHRILSVGAALEYAQINGMSDKVAIFMAMLGRKNTMGEYIDGMFFDLQEFYSSRNQEKLSMRPHQDDYGQSVLGQGTGLSGYKNPNGWNFPR